MNTRKQTGFTIVELLIVIVVIGILAAISIVAYNGLQDRARYSSLQADIRTLNTAIKMYHADNGHYPYVGATEGNRTNANIAPLLTGYLDKMPVANAPNSYYAYIWGVNGADYKIVRLVSLVGQLPAIEASHPNPDTRRTDRGWGYWSPGGESL